MIPLPLVVAYTIAVVVLGSAARKAYKGWRATHPRPVVPVVVPTATATVSTPTATTPVTPANPPWWKRALLWPIGGFSEERRKNAKGAAILGVVWGCFMSLLAVVYYLEGGGYFMLFLMAFFWIIYAVGVLATVIRAGGHVVYVLVVVLFAAIINWTIPWGMSFWRPVPEHGRAIHKSFMDVEKKQSLVGDYYIRKAYIGRHYPGTNNAGVVDYCYYFLNQFADAAGGRWKVPLKQNDMRACFELCKLGHDLVEDAPILRGCQGDYKKGACNRTQALDQLISLYEREDRNALYGGSNGCDENWGVFENVPDAP